MPPPATDLPRPRSLPRLATINNWPMENGNGFYLSFLPPDLIACAPCPAAPAGPAGQLPFRHGRFALFISVNAAEYRMARVCLICKHSASSVNDLNLHIVSAHEAESRDASGLLAFQWEMCSIYAPLCGACLCPMKLVTFQNFNCVNTTCDKSRAPAGTFKYATENEFFSIGQHIEHRVNLYGIMSLPLLALYFCLTNFFIRWYEQRTRYLGELTTAQLAELQKAVLRRVGEYSDQYPEKRVKDVLTWFQQRFRESVTERLRQPSPATRNLSKEVNSVNSVNHSPSATPIRPAGKRANDDAAAKSARKKTSRSAGGADDNPWKCTKCDHRGYQSKKSLDNHTLTKHSSTGILGREFAYDFP